MDIFILERLVEMPHFMLINVGKTALGLGNEQGTTAILGHDPNDPTAPPPDMAQQAQLTLLDQATGKPQKALRHVRTALKLAIVKTWGKYPERWKELKNSADLTAAKRRKNEKKLTPGSKKVQLGDQEIEVASVSLYEKIALLTDPDYDAKIEVTETEAVLLEILLDDLWVKEKLKIW
jgi:hypothetical protein